MKRVTYQGILAPSPSPGVYVRLGPEAIATRRRDARKMVTASVSAPQARWLREIGEVTGEGIDSDAVVRALIDLGMELEVDWPLMARGKMLRRAVREAVMVRRTGRG